MIVWTEAYRPFLMGGRCAGPIGINIPDEELGELHDVGRGFRAYLITSPAGREHVVEPTSGALIGGSLEQVRQDVAEGEEQVMRGQIEKALERREIVDVLSADEFWRLADKIKD